MFESRSNRLTFEQETHTYRFDEKVIPSVTQVMKQASEDHYAGISPQRLAVAADRGTRVHKAVELYELGIEVIDPEVQPYVTNYRVAKALKKFQPTEQELMLTNGIFAGTVDMIAELGGQQVLIDLKATAKFNKDLAEIQLAGYVQLCEYNGIGINGTYILHLTKDGHKLHRVTPNYEKWEELLHAYLSNLSSQ